MSGESAAKIITEMRCYVAEKGGQPSDWFVGTASEIGRDLFEKHRLPQAGHPVIYREAWNSREAQAVEEDFRQFGFDASLGGADRANTAVYVYVYLKSPNSRP